MGALIGLVLLSAQAIQGAGGPPPVGSVVIAPERIDLFRTSQNVFVQAKVLDPAGNPIIGADVTFFAGDPGLVFPYQEAFTDRDGIAANYLHVQTTDPASYAGQISARSGNVMAQPVLVVGNDLWADGGVFFMAPPLKPFHGSMQHVAGRVYSFGYLDDVRIWALDPTLAEPRNPVLSLDSRGQVLEFDVEAHREGSTIFLFESFETSIYVVDVTGDLFPPFIRGDVDGNGRIDLNDPVTGLNYLFVDGRPVPCLEALDADDSGRLDITDAVYTLQFMFLGGSPPPAPFPDLGPDPTPDALGCVN